MKSLLQHRVLVLLGSSLLACATPGTRQSTAAVDETADTPERISDAAGPVAGDNDAQPVDPTLRSEGEPPQKIPDDRKKLVEEYKALALKNDCSKGFPRLAGAWRFVGQTKTPNYSDNLVIEGTRFRETISGNPDGRYLSAELEGEVRCIFKNRVLIQIDKVKPEGAYGNHSGDAYPCDLLSDMDPTVDRMLMICFFDWDLRTAAGLEFEYERVEPK